MNPPRSVHIRPGTARAGWRTGPAPATSTSSAHRFVSRLAAARYLGYLQGQKAATPCTPCGPARLRDSAAVPDEPDRRWVDGWLHRSYLDFWASLP